LSSSSSSLENIPQLSQPQSQLQTQPSPSETKKSNNLVVPPLNLSSKKKKVQSSTQNKTTNNNAYDNDKEDFTKEVPHTDTNLTNNEGKEKDIEIPVIDKKQNEKKELEKEKKETEKKKTKKTKKN